MKAYVVKTGCELYFGYVDGFWENDARLKEATLYPTQKLAFQMADKIPSWRVYQVDVAVVRRIEK